MSRDSGLVGRVDFTCALVPKVVSLYINREVSLPMLLAVFRLKVPRLVRHTSPPYVAGSSCDLDRLPMSERNLAFMLPLGKSLF